MMASGREKREKAGEKLKDIIESLKGPKATKTDIETLNDSATASGETVTFFWSYHRKFQMNWTSIKRSTVLKDHFFFVPKVTS